MEYKNILNENLRIAAIHTGEITGRYAAVMLSQWEQDAPLESLTMYYDKAEDYLVLNQDHKNYSFYRDLAETYLEGDEAVRAELEGHPYARAAMEGLAVLRDCVRNRRTAADVRITRHIGFPAGHQQEVLDRLIESNNSKFMLANLAFVWGTVCGKRADRARRKEAGTVSRC